MTTKGEAMSMAVAGRQDILNPDDIWEALPEYTKKKLEPLTQKQRDYACLVSHGIDRVVAYRSDWQRKRTPGSGTRGA